MSHDAPRIGFWAPHQGPLIAHHDSEERATASLADNLALIEQGDRLGFDAVLIAQQLSNIRSADEPVLEPWTLAYAAALKTRKLELIVAIKPLLYHPAIAAKHLLGLAELSDGRAAINVVSGWFLPELQALGITSIAHDDRYAVAREWLAAVSGLIAGETVSQQGQHITVSNLKLVPNATTLGPVAIYSSGETEPGRDLAGRYSDVYFMHPRPLDQIAPTIAAVQQHAAPHGRALRFGLSSRIFARSTEAEAWAAFSRLSALAENNSRRGQDGAERQGQSGVSRTTSQAATDGTVIVGSYQQVADALKARAEAGIDLVMVQLQPVGAELDRIANDVFPLLGR